MLHRYARLSFALLVSGFLAFGCSKDSSGPTNPGDDGNAAVRDTKSQTIGADGGTVAMSSGVSVVFPAGAVSANAGFTVSEIEPTSYFEADSDLGRVVIECTGAVTEFDEAVEIRVPLPAGMTEADSALVFGGYIDEATGAREMVACSIRMIDGAPYGILPMRHFSSGFMEWLLGETPPASAGPLEIPYYGQGASSYCWAASLQMVTQAATFDKENDIPGIIGTVGVDESGLTSFAFRMSSTIAGIIKDRTGVKPDRCQWDFVNYQQMKDYLKREIGVRGYPVAVHSTAWNHAVVIVGYDGNTFYIHDPASTSTGSIGYTQRTWADMVKDMGFGKNMVCLTIPKTLDASRSLITANIMNDAVQFVRPGIKDDPQTRLYSYRWDFENKDGYRFQNVSSQVMVSMLPGEVITLKQGGDIEIVNASRTTSQEVSVWYDVTCLSQKGAYFSENKRFEVPANTTKNLAFTDIPVDEFRWNSDNPGEYSFVIRAMAGGTTVDEKRIIFKIDTRPVEITSFVPIRGGVGTPVTINGSGFGTIPKFTTVKFNGVEAEVDTTTWSNTKIIVYVPEKATTGPITVTNGDISKKSDEFTVTKETTLNDSFTYQTDAGFGDVVMSVSTSFSVTGEIMDIFISPDTNHYFYDVKNETNVSLAVSANAQLSEYVKTVTDSTTGYTTVTTYHEPQLTPFTDTEYDGWPLSTTGDFPYSASESAIDFTFEKYSDHLSISISFTLHCDVQTYNKEGVLVNENLNTYYNGRTVGIVSFSPY